MGATPDAHSRNCTILKSRSGVHRFPPPPVIAALLLQLVSCAQPQPYSPEAPQPPSPSVPSAAARPSPSVRPDPAPTHTEYAGLLPPGLEVISPENVGRLKILAQLPSKPGAAAVACSPDSHTLGQAAQLGKLVLWDLQSGERLHTLDTFLASDESREAYIAYPALAFSPDGTIVASTTESLETEGSAEIHNGGVGLWRTDAAADPLRIEPTWLYVTSVDFSPDGRLLVVGTKDGFMAQGGRLIVLQAESGDELRTIDIPGEGVRDLAFSPDGKLIAVAGVAGRVGLWETAGWESLGGLDAPASAVAFAPDGRKIVLNDGSMWDVTTLEMIREVPSAGLHFFSPDGRLLASANTDLTLLDMSTLQEVWHLAGRSDVAGAVFSPDGRILVAAMAEGVLNLWGVPSVP